MIHRVTCYTVLCLACLALPVRAGARTWLVRADASGDAPTIQAAVDSAAAFGDTVLLAAGEFTGPGNRGINFEGKALVMTSISGPGATVIDCEGQDRGFNFENSETLSSVLSGVTITGGNPGKSAGGIFCSGASPKVDNCVLRDNSPDGAGGGLFCTDFASPDVTNTRFTGNSATVGGAVYCTRGSTPRFIDCVFEGNSAVQNGGGIACYSFGRATLISCTIANNTAGNFGTALFAQNASPYFIQTIITSTNSASLIYCDVGAAPSFTCCDLFGEIVGGYGPELNGGNNVFEDPLFCGVDGSGNYFLRSDSPCAPGNSPCGALIGSLPVQCGTTANDTRTWGGVKQIFREQ